MQQTSNCSSKEQSLKLSLLFSKEEKNWKKESKPTLLNPLENWGQKTDSLPKIKAADKENHSLPETEVPKANPVTGRKT